MSLKKFFATIGLSLLLFNAPAVAGDMLDKEGYPVFYLRGEMTNPAWNRVDEYYRFNREGNTYSLTIPSLDGQFKISGTEWEYNFGADYKMDISDAVSFYGVPDGANLRGVGLKDVTITFTIETAPGNFRGKTSIMIDANGHKAPALSDIPLSTGLSNTLPVLYINVYKGETDTFDNEVIDPYLSHKNYFSGEYWLDLNGCEWMEKLGAESIGSKEEPLPLQIKARGNFTRTGFAKKPFKLKLDKKQKLLGMSNSKHFALLAHADDTYGYLRNFIGFNLGKRIGLPWTPSQQPVEVVINGDYRGLYFLTESIRIEKERINITGLDDNISDPRLVSGGYLVELDNYDEDNQIRMEEESFVGGYTDLLRITWDTPEEYSDLQKRFVSDQFGVMNSYIGTNNDEVWKYLDLDDAARYYLVEEIISHAEAYHGSTFLFRDHGEGEKWHFSPLWDCGCAFNGSRSDYFYNHSPFGNTWIPSMRVNEKFNNKVRETWLWLMTSRMDGFKDDVEEYISHIETAARCDFERWKNGPVLMFPIADNSDIKSRKDAALSHINDKINWLKGSFGDFGKVEKIPEPERDATEAAPLPEYAKGDSGISINPEDEEAEIVYYDFSGLRVTNPQPGNIYIKVALPIGRTDRK